MADFDEYEYLEKTVENQEGDENGDDYGEDEIRGLKRRTDEEDGEGRSKRSRSAEEHRSRGDEKGREKERDRSRDREKGRDRDRDKDREKDKDRHRDRERERDRDRERRGGDRERERGRGGRDHGHFRDRRDRRDKEPEPEADPERDQRTVFAYQINLKAGERDVYEFFSRAGKVRDVRLIMDRNSRRSKGVGYIEFYDVMSVPMAITLSGQLLLGTPVMVKPSEAEKNLAAQNPLPVLPGMAGMPGLPGAGFLVPNLAAGSKRLHIGNLHVNMNEEQLQQVFEPFGAVESVFVPKDQLTGQCKGFGFVQYVKIEDARAAQQNLNGLDLAGLPIKVTPVPENYGLPDAGPPVAAGELDDDEGGGLSLSARSRTELMMKLDRSASGGAATSIPSPALATSLVPTAGVGLLAQNPLAAMALRPGILGGIALPGVLPGAIASLPGAAAMLPIPPLPGTVPAAIPPQPVEAIGFPSECLLLKNMFDISAENDPEFDLEDIKEDVYDECSKFGDVKHIFVERGSAGHVWLKFDTAVSAAAAQRALHGRFFAGKNISATFVVPTDYAAKFPDS